MTTYQIMRRNTFIPLYQVLNSSSYIFPHTFNKHEKTRLQRENDPERWPLSEHLLVVRESPSCWDNMVMCTGWLFTFMYDLSMFLHLKCVIYSKGQQPSFFLHCKPVCVYTAVRQVLVYSKSFSISAEKLCWRALMTLISSHYRLILLQWPKSLFSLFQSHTYVIADNKYLPVKTILRQMSLSLLFAFQTSCH